MAKDARVVYRCDRCKHEEVDPDINRREQWTTIERDVSAYSHPSYLLCSMCLRDFEKWTKEPVFPARAVSVGGPYR